jgi:polysaccharide export outer membrane protein
MRTCLVLLCALAGLSGCTPTINYDYKREPDPRKLEYVIGISDGLKIQVWKNPELSSDVHVRPDGTITMPLIGDLRAAGLTPSQLKTDITQRLSTYVKDESAVVTISVTDPNSYRVTVSGNVEHPGVFTAKYYLTVLDAISLAGGLNKFASPHHMALMRANHDGHLRKIPLDFERLASGDHPDENLALMAGDTLVVQ